MVSFSAIMHNAHIIHTRSKEAQPILEQHSFYHNQLTGICINTLPGSLEKHQSVVSGLALGCFNIRFGSMGRLSHCVEKYALHCCERKQDLPTQ